MNIQQIGGGVLTALVLLLAQGSRADDKTVLVRPYKAGVPVIYKSIILTKAMGAEVRLESTSKQYIKEIKDNGQIVLVTEDQGGKTILNGQAQDQKPNPPTSENRDKSGKLVDYKQSDEQKGLIAPPIQQLLLSLNNVLFTDVAVKSGDSWETVLDNPAAKEAKVTVKTTYQGIDKVDGIDCWKFKQTADAIADANGAKLSEAFTAWLSPTDGMLYKLEGQTKDVPTQFGPLTFDISLKRVADEKKPAPKAENKEEKK